MERRVRKEEKQFNFIIHEATWMILEQQQMIIHSLSKFHFVVCLHWLQLTDTLIYNPLPVRLRNSLELVPQLKPMNSILSTNDWATFQNFASRHTKSPASDWAEKQKTCYSIYCWNDDSFQNYRRSGWIFLEVSKRKHEEKLFALQTLEQF